MATNVHILGEIKSLKLKMRNFIDQKVTTPEKQNIHEKHFTVFS